MPTAKKYRGMTPVHPELITPRELRELPDASIVSVTDHEVPLFEYCAEEKHFKMLFEERGIVSPEDLLLKHTPIRLVWVP